MLDALKDKKIGVMMGGLSAEREVSLTSGGAVLKALTDAGYDAHAVVYDGPSVVDLLKSLAPDVVFLALHGRMGEDGTVQGLMEVMGIPYTGAGVTGSAVAMDKAITKRLLKEKGIPTAEFFCVEKKEYCADVTRAAAAKVGYPLVVKPSTLGSTIGMSFVYKEEDLCPAMELAFTHDREVVVERYVEGREITAGVLDGRRLPLVEIVPKRGVYDYQAKYHSGDTTYTCPAKLDDKAAREIQDIAVEVFRALHGYGGARVDFRLDEGGRPWVLEMNTIPGMTGTSLLPKAAAAAGISFTALIEEILAGALRREKL